MADGSLPVRHSAASASYFTVKLNVVVWVTLFALLLAPPPAVGAVATAVIVTVDEPDGVVKMSLPVPQAATPARDASKMQPAAHCINSRRLAFLLLARPKRLRPSNRPLHQKIPVGVTIGA